MTTEARTVGIVPAPATLGESGRALWESVASRFAMAPHELVLLESACRHADMVARLEALLADDLVVRGSMGQPRLSAAVTELRQARLALSRLVMDLGIPADDGDEPVILQSPASRRASKAATYRHERARAVEVKRRASAS